jgi:hypothetical protein
MKKLLFIALLSACGSSASPGGATGGSIGTGGATGGSIGTGGATGTGGADAAGTGGATADASTPADGARDALPSVDGPPASTDGGATTGKTLDECFAGLRTLAGSLQVATRASTDGRYRMRLALETGDRGGTSGSYAWEAIRFGIEGPEGRVCVDEAALAGAYKGSHHNCSDVLTVTAEGRRYVVQNPDSARDYTDTSKWRRLARLTVSTGSTMTAGPIELATVSCDRGSCTSGGPCM